MNSWLTSVCLDTVRIKQMQDTENSAAKSRKSGNRHAGKSDDLNTTSRNKGHRNRRRKPNADSQHDDAGKKRVNQPVGGQGINASNRDSPGNAMAGDERSSQNHASTGPSFRKQRYRPTMANVPHISSSFVKSSHDVATQDHILVTSQQESSVHPTHEANAASLATKVDNVRKPLLFLFDCFINPAACQTSNVVDDQKSQNKHPKPDYPASANTRSDSKTQCNRIDFQQQSSIKEIPHKKGSSDAFSKKSKKPAKQIFQEYLSLDQIKEGIENGSIFQGVLRINKANRNDGYVTINGSSDTDVYIPGATLINRAFSNDVVAFTKLSGDELKKAMASHKIKAETKMMESYERQKKCNLFKTEDVVQEHVESRIYGKVVGIISCKTANRIFVGTLHLDRPLSKSPSIDKNRSSRWIWFMPSDKSIPFMIISKELAPKEFLADPESFANILVTATLKSWSTTDALPHADYNGLLGQMGELHVESKALLQAAGVVWDDFSDSVLDCLPSLPWSIPEEEIAKRWDLRKTRIFSIDPETAKDLDDAVSCRALPDGRFEVGVHIADVSYFVHQKTALDDEALYRATTVYLVQRAIPMLPRLLCEELCSLNPDVDRLAFSVFWIFDAQGTIIGQPRFGRSVIRSCAKLSYEHAQAVIDGKPFAKHVEISAQVTLEDISTDILQLYKFSKIMRKKRYDDGALSIHSIKLWFSLDHLGNPVESGMYELKDSNRLIEEYMLLANMAVAQKIHEHFPSESLLRRHPIPGCSAMTKFVEKMARIGIVIDASSSGSLQESFEAIEDPLHRMITRMVAIRTMRRAVYYSSGDPSVEDFKHYALCVPFYTHFTSPIRRYCDLVVHRLLNSVLEGNLEASSPYTNATIMDIAEQCNDRKDASREAQTASSKLFLWAYLKKLAAANRIESKNEGFAEIIAEAYVQDVGTRSYDVLVPSYGIDQRVWIEDAVETGEILGVVSDEENAQLQVYWKRCDDDDESIEALTQGLKTLDMTTQHDSMQDLRESEIASPFDPKTTKIQVIQMYTRVFVKIIVDMSQRMSFKLSAIYPHPNLGATTMHRNAMGDHLVTSLPQEMDD
ncbi:hypothetical protein BDEG_23256 [Batrachochytrium dendrobatidis JEL423]|nr:hypothetical protein BDEG_23256 [Batrachochytrium dendrobatidis JEL423]